MASQFLRNYLSTILLLVGVIIGGAVGIIFGPGASVLRPVGTLFLNLVFVLVVPIVFVSVANAMIGLRKNGLMGRVLLTAVGVFLAMSVVVAMISYASVLIYNPFQGMEGTGVSDGMSDAAGRFELPLGDTLVAMFTVSDFVHLLSKDNLLPLVVIAIFFGLAVSSEGPKAQGIASALQQVEGVIFKMMKYVMYFAPIGIGCYFADTVGTLGSQIVGGFMKMLVMTLILTLVIFFVLHSAYILLFTKIPLGTYWRNMIEPSLTAMGTCSSAASMPVTIEAVRGMGASPAIAQSVVPLGINLHKDGSVLIGIYKVVLAMVAFSQFTPSVGNFLLAAGVTILVSTVVGAIPIGGMTGEILICSVLGLDPSFAATLLIIGTLCDIPATLLNTSANATAAAMVDGLSGTRARRPGKEEGALETPAQNKSN